MKLLSTLLTTLMLLGCYSTYTPVTGAATALVTLHGHSLGGTEIFTYEESCDDISSDSNPLRLGGTGAARPTDTFTIEADRKLLIGISFTSTTFENGACLVAYEATFDEGVSYQFRTNLIKLDQKIREKALHRCELGIIPKPRTLKKYPAKGGLLPRPVC